MNSDLVDAVNAITEILAAMKESEAIGSINYITEKLNYVHPLKREPVSSVKWVPAEMVTANDYNPNSVAPPEMKLLHLSIKEDGYTQPIVTYWDDESGKYIIVDGFHRNRIGREKGDIKARVLGMLPIVEIDKPIEDRIASTIRHNRARGKHAIDPMINIVARMLSEGMSDSEVARNLGMDADELLRFKQNTGLGDLFKDREYSKSWGVE